MEEWQLIPNPTPTAPLPICNTAFISLLSYFIINEIYYKNYHAKSWDMTFKH